MRVAVAFACPVCRARLDDDRDALACTGCGHRYGRAAGGIPDLRLPAARSVRVECTLRPRYADPRPVDVLAEPPGWRSNHPELAPPAHAPIALLAQLPRADDRTATLLDLGCGGGAFRPTAEALGYRYVGLDYGVAEGACALADAQSIPLADASVGVVWSVSVLQYVEYPAVAFAEIRRVLADGGRFIGTVPFLEPFSGGHFHMSHLGVASLLEQAGFDVDLLAPSASWTAPTSLARMALFPGLPGWLSRLLVSPVDLLSRGFWAIGGLLDARGTARTRTTKLTGSWSFVATAR